MAEAPDASPSTLYIAARSEFYAGDVKLSSQLDAQEIQGRIHPAADLALADAAHCGDFRLVPAHVERLREEGALGIWQRGEFLTQVVVYRIGRLWSSGDVERQFLTCVGLVIVRSGVRHRMRKEPARVVQLFAVVAAGSGSDAVINE